ncbi:MAG: hypothetical protein U9Q15_05310 [Patescibacteria group bacterium]|nr:hypothetical protein [Patescibacteria group bacterium]
MTLSQLTYRAQEQDFAAVAEILDLSVEDVEFCYDCVGNTERKGCILVGEEMITVTHFTHQCRVAFHVQNSFPEDLWSRRLALFHDCKEEAVEGKELKYKELGDIAQWIDILTEIKPSDQEAEEFDQQLPEGNWDAK